MLGELDIAAVDLREVRADALAADETYSKIMNSHGLIQNHRALKRELCLTRAALVCLLFVCTAVCILGYFQQIPGFKDKEDHAKTNGKLPAVSGALADVQPAGIAVQRFISLCMGRCEHFEMKGVGNMTWRRSGDLQGFSLDQYNKSLIIPQAGFYKVALQITYGEDVRKGSTKGQINMDHQLKVYTDAYREVITHLWVHETVYRDKDWSKSVYSEKVILLESGDRLVVQTSNLSLVRCANAEQTFLTAQLESPLPE